MKTHSKPQTLERLELTGGPHERGLTHGDAFAEEIEANVERYLKSFEYYGAGEETVYEQAEEFTRIIEAENEAYFTEMEGIAAGADVDIVDVALLNARWEVMYSAYADAAEEAGKDAVPDGCTAMGAQPEITADGHTIIGQNWDWKPDIDIFVMDIRRDDGTNMVVMTEAGIVGGKIGVNERGIGMLLNGLVASGDGEQPFRKPYHVRFREALDAERLHDAIQPLIEKDRANSANVLLAHAEGEMINLELAPETENYLHPREGLLTHANHFEDRSRVDSEFERIVPSSLCRAPRLQRLLSKQRGDISVRGVREALQDHFGHPDSICMHENEEDPEMERAQTNGSFVMDLNERRLLGTYGPPCENEYTEFVVAD